MSPQRIENNFEGTSALPQTLRNQGGRRWMSDAFPQPTDAGVIDRFSRMDNWLEPIFDCTSAADEAWELASTWWKDDDGRIISRLLEVGDDWEVRRTVREETA